MSEESNINEEPQVVDLGTFTSVEQFDARIAELAATPTVENLRLHAEAVAARAEYTAAVAAVASAEQAIADEAAAAEAAAVAEAEQVVAEAAAGAEIVDQTVEVSAEAAAPADTVEANPELIAAAVAAPVVRSEDPAPTAKTVTSRKATVTHHSGLTSAPVTDIAHMEQVLRSAVRGSGDTEQVLSFPVWDRETVGEDNILKAKNDASHNDRIMGVTDSDGNPLVGVRDFRAAVKTRKAGLTDGVHRAACGGCDDCGGMMTTPDCFAEYGEPLGARFQAVAADRCSWNVEKQMTLADLDQQVYIYCPVDEKGEVGTPGLLDADGNVIPIDPDDPATWKQHVEITTTCGPKTKYSLEEFPLLFTVDRSVDFCSEEGAVTRTLNRYFALQSRFMESRKKDILRGWGLDNGFAAQVACSGRGLPADMKALLGTIAGVIQAQAGVDALEGYELAVPAGMGAWAGSEALNMIQGEFGISAVVECAGNTSPYADTDVYALTPGEKLVVDPNAEARKVWEFVAYDPAQWRKPVAETVRIGVNDTFRDFDLARQNKRGIVVYRDETLIPVGCVPSICLDGDLDNTPVDPARSTVTNCG